MRVRLYTIQTADAWAAARKHKRICREGKSGIEPEYLNAYDWIIGQLKTRIAGYVGRYPYWAWKERPDLRSRRRFGGRGDRLVLVEFEADTNDILESHFEAWHYVLNNWYLPKDFRSLRLNEKVPQNEKVASWQRIFDIKWVLKKFGKNTTTQVCVECINSEDIISERYFTV